jgi:hypothetical protein
MERVGTDHKQAQINNNRNHNINNNNSTPTQCTAIVERGSKKLLEMKTER